MIIIFCGGNKQSDWHIMSVSFIVKTVLNSQEEKGMKCTQTTEKKQIDPPPPKKNVAVTSVYNKHPHVLSASSYFLKIV